MSGEPLLTEDYDPLDVDKVRDTLQKNCQMAFPHLVYAALQHSSDGITNTDQKLASACKHLPDICKKCGAYSKSIAGEVRTWIIQNRCKAIFLVVGLGGTAFKARTLAHLMEDQAVFYINWSKSASTKVRFLGFIGLMTLRLIVSTLVPPTSPGFSIIVQLATPESEKWTAMPLFLAASTVAGGFPYLLDKLLQVCFRCDFVFTKTVKRCIDVWPLTCWTGPAMRAIFEAAHGGKSGASLAVIFAHAAPFMGAQTTMMQRFFLPHPLDTLISQPFGMSEDLISMAMAEAKTDPYLSSVTLTGLIVAFNLAQFVIFKRGKDCKALLTAFLNIFVGWLVAYVLLDAPAITLPAAAEHLPGAVTKEADALTQGLMKTTTDLKHNTKVFELVQTHRFYLVGLQLAVQIFITPILLAIVCFICGRLRCKTSQPEDGCQAKCCMCCRRRSKPPTKPRGLRPSKVLVQMIVPNVAETKPLQDNERKEAIQELLGDPDRFSLECKEVFEHIAKPGASSASSEQLSITAEQLKDTTWNMIKWCNSRDKQTFERIDTIVNWVDYEVKFVEFQGLMASVLTQIGRELEDRSKGISRTPRPSIILRENATAPKSDSYDDWWGGDWGGRLLSHFTDGKLASTK